MNYKSLLITTTFVISAMISVAQDLSSVKIGTQIWTSENLKLSTFNNGDPIPEAKTKEEWLKAANNGKPAWCYYDNDNGNEKEYGKLYNRFAIIDPRGLAPKGWHIPSNAEWKILTDFLGGESVAGAKMKSSTGWYLNNNATNESGFTGLPGGYRNENGTFIFKTHSGFWWSCTEDDKNTNNAWFRYLYYGSNSVYRYSGRLNYKLVGLSVRCLKDDNGISIKGKLLNFKGDKTYLVDVSDKSGLRVPDNIPVLLDANNEFKLNFNLNEPGYYKLEVNTLYITPGDELQLIIDCSDKNNSTFKGKGSEACNYLKTIPGFSQVDIGYLGRNAENITKDIQQFTTGYMLPRAEKSFKELDNLKMVSSEFKELERARIKSNVIQSIMLYTAFHTRKYIEGYDYQKHKDLFNKTREEQINQSMKVLMEYGQGLAKAENIVLPEFRKILVWIKDSKGEYLPKYNRIDRIEDYELTEQLLQKYASCFTSSPPRVNPNEVLLELENAKVKMTTPLYRELIDKSIHQYGDIKKGAPVFDFTGFDSNNNPVKLSQFKGKYIYLDFWATWCGPCINEYPFFQELYQKFKDGNNIVFISVSTDQDKDKWRQYMKEHTHETISIHVNSSYLSPYKIAFIPRFILIDKDFNFLDPFAPRPSQPATEELLKNLK
ncbi:MAG: FISUMP domain-containing protein [Bacteroidales bacterium]|jgi:uncharacterized protein (TIGR02145 family)